MFDWNTYPAELSKRVKEMSQLARNVVAGFFALDRGANKTTYSDTKTRELIAIAIAVTTRCDGCIGVHTHRAIGAGATREEVAETLGAAIALNAGAALAYAARVLDAYRRSTARRSQRPNRGIASSADRCHRPQTGTRTVHQRRRYPGWS